MKKVRLSIPKNRDEATAEWLYANEVRMLLSYATDDFFGAKIIIICAVSDEKLAAFQAEFKNYIK